MPDVVDLANAVARSDLSDGALRLYLVLVNLAGSTDGEVSIGRRALAYELGIGTTTLKSVTRWARELAAAGAVRVHHGRQTASNRYELIGLPVAARRPARRCAYCGQPADTDDHVLPRSKGGTRARANMVPACGPCNSSKNGRTPEDWWAATNPGEPFPADWPRAGDIEPSSA